MSEPGRLRLKRKATAELPPDYLIVHGDERVAKSTKSRYVRQRTEADHKEDTRQALFAQNGPPIPLDTVAHTSQLKQRFYQLQPTGFTTKRRGTDNGVATVVERGTKRSKPHEEVVPADMQIDESAPPRPLKRPGRGTAVRTARINSAKPETEVHRKQVEALAGYMHQATLEEIKRESQLKAVAAPKLSGARSRELHRQRTATNGSVTVDSEVGMEDEDDFVYDTYILAPTTELGATEVDMQTALGNVGYVVITKEDQSLWETYLEDELSDEDAISDEDDENAEGHYGADYPEDELASDDENDRNAYGYRGYASDDEEWDEDTAAWSDDEEGHVMSPFKNRNTLSQFAKYLETG